MINLSVKSSSRLDNYEFSLNAINLKIKKNCKKNEINQKKRGKITTNQHKLILTRNILKTTTQQAKLYD